MSFLPAVQREINNRNPGDPIRVALEYLVEHAVGRHNAIPLSTLVTVLSGRGVHLTETDFQQTVLAQSRDRDYCIGSGRSGYFLIESQADAEEMRDSYEN
jgi:hypothetical protein